MELYLSLFSPVWWAGVLVCTILLSAVSSWLARRSDKHADLSPQDTTTTAHRLRRAAWVVGLLVLANLAMLGTLAAANLRTPRIAGPVGLALVLCCLISLVLAVLVHGATGPRDG